MVSFMTCGADRLTCAPQILSDRHSKLLWHRRCSLNYTLMIWERTFVSRAERRLGVTKLEQQGGGTGSLLELLTESVPSDFNDSISFKLTIDLAKMTPFNGMKRDEMASSKIKLWTVPMTNLLSRKYWGMLLVVFPSSLIIHWHHSCYASSSWDEMYSPTDTNGNWEWILWFENYQAGIGAKFDQNLRLPKSW